MGHRYQTAGYQNSKQRPQRVVSTVEIRLYLVPVNVAQARREAHLPKRVVKPWRLVVVISCSRSQDGIGWSALRNQGEPGTKQGNYRHYRHCDLFLRPVFDFLSFCFPLVLWWLHYWRSDELFNSRIIIHGLSRIEGRGSGGAPLPLFQFPHQPVARFLERGFNKPHWQLKTLTSRSS